MHLSRILSNVRPGAHGADAPGSIDGIIWFISSSGPFVKWHSCSCGMSLFGQTLSSTYSVCAFVVFMTVKKLTTKKIVKNLQTNILIDWVSSCVEMES